MESAWLSGRHLRDCDRGLFAGASVCRPVGTRFLRTEYWVNRRLTGCDRVGLVVQRTEVALCLFRLLRADRRHGMTWFGLATRRQELEGQCPEAVWPVQECSARSRRLSRCDCGR